MTGTLPTGVQVREGERLLGLVRHGRTAWNAERRFLGRSDVPLDEAGEAEVARLAAACAGSFRVVISSPLTRARQTAATLAAEVSTHADLSELDQGALEGLDGATAFARHADFFQAWQADPLAVACPGGESVAACFARARRAVDALARANVEGPIAIVSHQVVIGSLLAWSHGDSPGAWRRYAVPNASVSWVAWSEGGLRVLRAGWLPGSDLAG